ncbi:MAG: ABC transporter substrate-binding protein [Anaerolineales bacterium]|nr:ABC transporter substrate-binding protein [Anaerolineales bacterium]MCA9974755.1 ABC transporter substrate-binding protein [Anaerolineales bacterium]MCB8968096.1 ABC transporter substrate-binding protein [Ardenticatenaceae bacterium]
MTQYQPRYHVKRSVFILLFLIVALSLLISGCSTSGASEKTYRVGVLAGLSFVADITDGFKEAMTELGYVEGENITYDVRLTEFDIPTYQSILQELIEDEVDLILVFPTEASIEAKNAAAGTDVPVIFNFAQTEGTGLIESIREPGGNITGVRYPGPDLALRRFEILRELVPDATRILVPYQKGYPIVQSQLDIIYPAAEAAGVTLIEMPAETPAELASLLQELGATGSVDIDAVLFIAEPLIIGPEASAAISSFSREYNIPMGGAYFSVDGYGSLFGVNVDPIASGKLAAPLADKIFQDIPAGSIPVISAEMFMQIDYGMAQKMGLEIPEELLILADEVIR